MYHPIMTERIERAEGVGWRGSHREPRVGVMLHYDGSGSDRGAVAWFRDPRARGVGYHWLVLDDGTYVELAPESARCWHAGVCRPSQPFREHRAEYRDANSAFVGISVAATDGERATPEQALSVAALCAVVFRREGWTADQGWRITGHSAEAWPRGRKVDPEGTNSARPVLDPTLVRFQTRTLLRGDG